MGNLPPWTKEDIVVEGTDQRGTLLKSSSKGVFKHPTSVYSRVNSQSLSCCLSFKQRGNFRFGCRLKIINIDRKSALTCSMFLRQMMCVICKYGAYRMGWVGGPCGSLKTR